eukprot:CAMPEP_0118651766 /NCGR_PEP_ID=MMETSP0785-20121206/10956_1 /TAXON_ID=91992 /ORGANISM="Bolidomonas pacifica, Strain CCMP 1866" /LENGTH=424 /DNA_ID=CAMNT_0006544231 /DNA_START=621 /DNA_END=1892 /DNA_ORIENTATION=-
MYEKSIEEADQKKKAMKARYDVLKKEEKATFELGNFIMYYINNERRYSSSPLPRYQYDIQGARLKGARGGQEDLSTELKKILDIKCPTWDFTLADFFATHSLDLDDGRRQLVNKKKQASIPFLNQLLEDPASLALHVFGVVTMTPIKCGLYAISIAWERYGPNPVDEEESKRALNEAISLSVSIFSPIAWLLKLGEVVPALDYRKNKYSRKIINTGRRYYNKYFLKPFSIAWEGPEILYNATVKGASVIMSDPDTHEFRLLKMADKAVESHKKVMKKKIEDHRKVLNFDYGPLYAIADMCFAAPIGKYNYNVCILKDVRQDATKMGTFTGWVDEKQRSYKIENGATCHGVMSVDTKGNSVQVKRSGTVTFSCGDSHSVLSVTENQPCVYDIQMQTYLVCDNKELEGTTKALETLLSSLEGGGSD